MQVRLNLAGCADAWICAAQVQVVSPASGEASTTEDLQQGARPGIWGAVA